MHSKGQDTWPSPAGLTAVSAGWPPDPFATQWPARTHSDWCPEADIGAEADPDVSLEARVLSWTHATVTNKTVFEAQALSIPTAFESAEQYGKAFKWHVAEEVRAQLHQAFDNIGRQPCYKAVLTGLRDTDFTSSMSSSQCRSTRRLSITVLCSHGSVLPGSHFKPTDMVLISNIQLQHKDDFARSGLCYSLGIIMGGSAQDDGGQATPCRDARLLLADDSNLAAALHLSIQRQDPWHIYNVGSLATPNRIFSALQQISMPASAASSSALLHQLMCQGAPSGQTSSQHLPLSQTERLGFLQTAAVTTALLGQDASLVQHLLDCGLNQSQAVAVAAVSNSSLAAGIAVARSSGSRTQQHSWDKPAGLKACIHLIQGPPGTGKTSTIVQLLLVLAHRRVPVLMCAPTNVAVQEVAGRLVRELAHQQQAPPGAAITASDFCLVMSGEMDSSAPLAHIVLAQRAKRLAEVLNRAAGWTAALNHLSLFLKQAEQQHADHQADTTASQQQHSEAFKPWAARQLAAVSADLQRMVYTINTDLPSATISPVWVQQAVEVPLRLGQMLEVLQSLTEAQAKAVFTNFNLQTSTEQFTAASAVTTSHAVAKARALVGALQQQLVHAASPLRSDVQLPATVTLQSLQPWLLKQCRVVFCTVSTAGSYIMRTAAVNFGVCVIDEAGQLVEAEASIVLAGWPCLPVMALVGDHKQLPATVISDMARKRGYMTSLFERLQAAAFPIQLLDTQYRMQPPISCFPSSQFYLGQVVDGSNVIQATYGLQVRQLTVHLPLPPFCFINVKGLEARQPGQSSVCNEAEAWVVSALTKQLTKASRSRTTATATIPAPLAAQPSLSIGLITPYKLQVELLAELLNLQPVSKGGAEGSATSGGLTVEAVRGYIKRLNRQTQAEGAHGASGGGWNGAVEIEARSVDGFQGREMDVIILSTVRSNPNGMLGFVDDARRLNVSITRARHLLCIVGNAATLCRGSQVWAALIQAAHSRGAYVEAQDIDADLGHPLKRFRQQLGKTDGVLRADPQALDGLLWKVNFSSAFTKGLAKFYDRAETRAKNVMSLVYALAAGHHRSRIAKHASQSPSSSQAGGQVADMDTVHVEVLRGSDMRLVWTVGVDKTTRSQILQVWDVVPGSGVATWQQRLHNLYNNYGEQRRAACAITDRLPNGLITPHIWHADEHLSWGEVRAAADGSQPLEQSSMGDSLAVMHMHELDAVSACLLCHTKCDEQLQLLFKLNYEEQLIVDYPKSAFVLGRSGTGKTCVITARVIAKERAHAQLSGLRNNQSVYVGSDQDGSSGSASGLGPLRQLILTANAILCSNIKEAVHAVHTVDAKAAAAAASSTGTAAAEASAGEASGSAGVATVRPAAAPVVLPQLAEEREAALLAGVPDSFMGVADEQCAPMAITLRRLLTMLDGCCKVKFGYGHGVSTTSPPAPAVHDQASTLTLSPITSPGLEVDFDRFCHDYYPHLDATTRRALDVAAVWTAIQTDIKGSREALYSPCGRLPEAEFLALANKRSSQLNKQQRARVYQLFLQYEQRKGRSGGWDIADFTYHVHFHLRGAYRGVMFHHIYVDEVQDLTPAQICLLRFLCNNPAHGFFIAGDTAQTIGRGVSYSFAATRNLFYSEFLRQDTASETNAGAAVEALSSAGSIASKLQHCTGAGHAQDVPDVFQLQINYRTHAGVVRVGASLVDLLVERFPHTLDRLAPERSMVAGDPVCAVPMWLEFDASSDPLEYLLANERDLGAEQAILVRDEATKQQVMQRLPNRGMVLTVHEAKGLEFQDVIIYNFFAASPFQNSWRVLYTIMKDQGLLAGADAQASRFASPVFEAPGQHTLLASELKQLYVLCTRPKRLLLFFDEKKEWSQPMLDFWLAHGLVKHQALDDVIKGALQDKASTAEDWRRKGNECLAVDNLPTALFCFEKAGDQQGINLTRAAIARKAAESLRASKPAEAVSKFQVAAQHFQEVARLELAADMHTSAAACAENAEAMKHRGAANTSTAGWDDYRKAGDLYSKLKMWQRAGCSFESCHAFTDAARIYSQGGNEEVATALQAAHSGSEAVHLPVKAAELYARALHVCQRSKSWDIGLELLTEWLAAASAGVPGGPSATGMATAAATQPAADVSSSPAELDEEAQASVRLRRLRRQAIQQRRAQAVGLTAALQAIYGTYVAQVARQAAKDGQQSQAINFAKLLPTEEYRTFLERHAFRPELRDFFVQHKAYLRAAGMSEQMGHYLAAVDQYAAGGGNSIAAALLLRLCKGIMLWQAPMPASTASEITMEGGTSAGSPHQPQLKGWPIKAGGPAVMHLLDRAEQLMTSAVSGGQSAQDQQHDEQQQLELQVLQALCSGTSLQQLGNLHTSANSSPWLQLLLARAAFAVCLASLCSSLTAWQAQASVSTASAMSQCIDQLLHWRADLQQRLQQQHRVTQLATSGKDLLTLAEADARAWQAALSYLCVRPAPAGAVAGQHLLLLDVPTASWAKGLTASATLAMVGRAASAYWQGVGDAALTAFMAAVEKAAEAMAPAQEGFTKTTSSGSGRLAQSSSRAASNATATAGHLPNNSASTCALALVHCYVALSDGAWLQLKQLQARAVHNNQQQQIAQVNKKGGSYMRQVFITAASPLFPTSYSMPIVLAARQDFQVQSNLTAQLRQALTNGSARGRPARQWVDQQLAIQVQQQRLGAPVQDFMAQYHPVLAYQDVAKVVLLQALLPQNLLNTATVQPGPLVLWALDPSLDVTQMQPYQLLMLSSLHQDMIRQAVAQDTVAGLQPFAIQRVVTCGIRGLYFMNNSFDPFTFTTLMERFSLLAIACTTLVHNAAAPTSMVLNAAGDPGNADMYSALLRRGMHDDGRSKCQTCLNDLAARIASYLASPQITSDWLAAFGYSAMEHQGLLTARLTVLLLTIAVNFRVGSGGYGRVGSTTPAGSEWAIQSAARAIALLTTAPAPGTAPSQQRPHGTRGTPPARLAPAIINSWPLPLQRLVLELAALPRGSFSRELGSRFRIRMRDFGDSLVRLTRQSTCRAKGWLAGVKACAVDLPSTDAKGKRQPLQFTLRALLQASGEVQGIDDAEAEPSTTAEVGLDQATSDVQQSDDMTEQSNDERTDDDSERLAGLTAFQAPVESAPCFAPYVLAGLQAWQRWVQRKLRDQVSPLDLLQRKAHIALHGRLQAHCVRRIVYQLCPLQVQLQDLQSQLDTGAIVLGREEGTAHDATLEHIHDLREDVQMLLRMAAAEHPAHLRNDADWLIHEVLDVCKAVLAEVAGDSAIHAAIVLGMKK